MDSDGVQRRKGSFCNRQGKAEIRVRGSRMAACIDGDCTVVQGCYIFYNIQTKTCSVAFMGDERVKKSGKIFFRDAWAVVTDMNLQICSAYVGMKENLRAVNTGVGSMHCIG